jgi:hypothetical protein
VKDGREEYNKKEMGESGRIRAKRVAKEVQNAPRRDHPEESKKLRQTRSITDEPITLDYDIHPGERRTIAGGV